MIGMTEKAAKKMEALLAGGKATAGIRIDVQGNPCCRPSYRFELVERPAEGDYLLEDGGIRIYFDPARARALFNVEIDHDGAGGAEGFTVTQGAPCG